MASSDDSEGSRSSDSSNSWRYFAARDPVPDASRTQPALERLCTASRTASSSSDITGSRFEDWLHASRSEFTDSGYWSGVVRCFSTRQPRTRSSTAVSRCCVEVATSRSYARTEGPAPAPRWALGAHQRLVLDAVRLERLRAAGLAHPVGVLGEVALEPRDLRVALEGEDVRRDPVEEPAIVGDDDGAS